MPRLFHFSEDAGIAAFAPRPVRVPSARPEGKEWLNGPLVWAIDAAHAFLYLFPRECPRIVLWSTPDTSAEDRARWLGQDEIVAYIEPDWVARVATAAITRYELDATGFEDLGDAGMWVSRGNAAILERTMIADLPAALAMAGVRLAPVDALEDLRPVWGTSLRASGIRLRNARTWQA